MSQRQFDILTDSPILLSPNGGEQFYEDTVVITWREPSNIETTTDIIWYEIFITEVYSVEFIANLIQIATIPSGNTSFTYNIHKNFKGKKCRIGIRAVNHKGQRGEISFSANNFIISSKKLPVPAIFSPTPNTTYFSYIPIIIDHKAVLSRCSQRAFYHIYYKSNSLNIGWRLAFSDIMVGSSPINWDVSSFSNAFDYSLKIELVDGENTSKPIFIDNVTINNLNCFIIDTVAPDGKITVENNAEYIRYSDIILSLLASDFATGVKEYRIEQTSVSATGEKTTDTSSSDSFSPFTSLATWNILGGDGEKLIQARFKDYGGNVVSTDENKKYFRTYKSLDNMEVGAILFAEGRLWIAFSNENNPSSMSSLYRDHTLISTLQGEPTALQYYDDAIYIAIRDSENKGILQRYSGGIIESVADNEEEYLDENNSIINSLYSADSVITSMSVFDDLLFIGLENGKLLSFSGSSILLRNDDYANVNKINKLVTDHNILYVCFENTTELMAVNKLLNGNYNYTIIDSWR